MKTEDFKEEFLELQNTKVRVTVYRIGDEFHCHICNADPGATIARATAGDRERALQLAMEKATARLKKS